MAFGNDISNDDRALLSAYIDNELPAEQQQALEERLVQEPTLRQELEELRTVVRALQGLPDLKAPRDFTVTPDMLTDVPNPALSMVHFPLGVVSALSGAAATFLVGLGLFLLLASSGQQAERASVVPLENAAEVAQQPTQTTLEAVPQVESFSEESEADMAGDAPPESAEIDTPREESLSAEDGANAEMGTADDAFAPPARMSPPGDAGGFSSAEEAPQAAQRALSPTVVASPEVAETEVADVADGLMVTPAQTGEAEIEADMEDLDDDVSISVITSEPALGESLMVSPENDSTASGIPMTGVGTGVSEPTQTLAPQATPRSVTDPRWLGLSLVGLGIALAGVSAGAAIRLWRRNGRK